MGKDRETARRQERKREQEMLGFPLDVRCSRQARSLPSFLASALQSQKEKEEAGFTKAREKKSFYFVVSDADLLVFAMAGKQGPKLLTML